jgi:hypothetical protein
MNGCEQQRAAQFRSGHSRLRVLIFMALFMGVALVLSGAWVAAEVGPTTRRSAASLTNVGDSGAQVGLDPSTVHLDVGATQVVSVTITGVTDLYGFEFDLSFDPAVIAVQAVEVGDFLNPDFVVARTFDNTAGLVKVAITQLSPSTPKTGDGLLATILFEAIAPGDAEVEFLNVQLSNSDAISLGCVSLQPDVVVLQASPTESETPTATATPTLTPTATATVTATATATATVNPDATPYYYLEPSALSLDVGQTGQMQIRTSYVQGLGGVGLAMRWDPAKVQVVDAQPGTPGVQVAPGDLFAGHNVMQPTNGNTVDNAAGTLSYAIVYLGDPPGVDGEWTVATITFTAMSAGSTIVEFYGPDTLMTDADGLSLPSGWINGQIQIIDTQLTPTVTPTATPDLTPTATPVPVVLCFDSIQNGGFEQEGQGWVRQGGTTFDGIPRSGARSAWLGGYSGAVDGIDQTVTIPADATSATLNYWWYLYTTKTDHPNDYFYTRIHDASGVLLEELATQSDGSLAGEWQEVSHDLLAYAGQTIRVSFLVETQADTGDGTFTSFYVDDVTLEVCVIEEEPAPAQALFIPLVMDEFVK